MGTHLFFPIKVYSKKSPKVSSVKPSKSSEGEIVFCLYHNFSHTLGTGNIVGVSTAVSLGGPGAVFWCW